MKYGILTYHGIPNIGAVLQAFALCSVLRNLGVDCEIIDYRCENIVKRELTFQKTNNKIKDFFRKQISWHKTEKKIEQCIRFLKPMYSDEKYNIKNIKSSNKIYDVFISGSDMIWNLSVNGYDYTYFLDFADKNKFRFSYSSSIGDEWNKNDCAKIRSLLSDYNYLSVREKDTCDFILNNFKIDCKYTVDPTMLLTLGEWKKFVKPVKEKNYVFVYFSSNGALQHALEYGKKYNKKVIACGFRFSNLKYKYVNIYSPDKWISYIANADAVFTSSYHGLLFSLYFHKQVWCFNECNRINTLLDNLGLNNALYSNDKEFDNIIDYKKCELKMDSLRRESMQYLKNCICRAENWRDENAY